MLQCLNMPAAAPLTCLPKACLKKHYGEANIEQQYSSLPVKKWPLNTHNSPLYLSTAVCLWVSPLLTHPLSWVICCVNTVYLQLTGPFSCGAGNAITGSKHLHCYHWRVQRAFQSPLQQGPLLICISFEEGITNEAIWKSFVLGKEFAHTHVCVCVNGCVYERQTEIMCVSKCRCHSSNSVECDC